MVKVLKNTDAAALENLLNELGPSVQIIAMYSILQNHFAWVRVDDAPKNALLPKPKPTKGFKHGSRNAT